AGLAQAVALHRLGENDGRRALMFDSCFVRGKDLLRIVSAARQLLQLLVREMFDEFDQFGIFTEEMLADIGAALDAVTLILAVDDLGHALDEQADIVLYEEGVPVAARDDFDDVPAGAAEGGFQLLDDLAVAAHRAVEALEVAVDDEDQVVEPFARGQGDGAEALRLVGLAVAQEAPNFL